jgi:LysM domain
MMLGLFAERTRVAPSCYVYELTSGESAELLGAGVVGGRRSIYEGIFMRGSNVVRWLYALGGALAFSMSSRCALAFPVVVQPGDTLAGIAQRIYGRVEYEGLLVSANGLDAHGGIAITPGMRLEVPALAYRRVAPGDTWASLATVLLGSAARAPVLAFANAAKPWLSPTENAELLIPYNLRFVAEGAENISDVAERFLGEKNRARMLASYNGIENMVLEPGQLLLVPLTDLQLTAAGQQAARRALEGWGGVGGEHRAEQAAAGAELPALLTDVRRGRYAEAVARGVALLVGASLTTPQRAAVQRQLLEAYAALGATGRAADACREWRRAAPHAHIDPVEMSPKLVAACRAR